MYKTIQKNLVYAHSTLYNMKMMMKAHETPASRRTKDVIAASLKKLMETKPLTKIAVREILADCEINRGTFYYHFQDTYDVVKYILEKEAYPYLASHATLSTYEDAIRFVLAYARSNKYIVQCALDSFAYEELRLFFHKDIYRTIQAFIIDFAKDRNISDQYLDFLTNFYTYALVNLLLDWIRNGMKASDEEIIRNVRTVVSGTVKTALDNAEKEHC